MGLRLKTRLRYHSPARYYPGNNCYCWPENVKRVMFLCPRSFHVCMRPRGPFPFDFRYGGHQVRTIHSFLRCWLVLHGCVKRGSGWDIWLCSRIIQRSGLAWLWWECVRFRTDGRRNVATSSAVCCYYSPYPFTAIMPWSFSPLKNQFTVSPPNYQS